MQHIFLWGDLNASYFKIMSWTKWKDNKTLENGDDSPRKRSSLRHKLSQRHFQVEEGNSPDDDADQVRNEESPYNNKITE